MAQIELIAAARFFNEGSRGMRGGAAQNDKIWGIARVQGTLVRFWGRRNGGLKFKTEIGGLRPLLNTLSEKTAKGYDEMGPRTTAELCPTLMSDLSSHYYSAMSRGKLNTRH
jgi:hypothetical protein